MLFEIRNFFANSFELNWTATVKLKGGELPLKKPKIPSLFYVRACNTI
jgi:hypothetical protein